MQTRFLTILGASVLLLAAKASPSFAEDKIQAFVSDGRVIFTNLVGDNAPTPEATAQSGSPGSTGSIGSIGSKKVLADEVPHGLRALVDTISANHGVDPGLVRAVMKTESNFNRFARSPKGALGLMQLIPETGRRYGVNDFFDPKQNVEGGVRYLRFLLDKFKGNIDLALAGYNAGENLVERLGRIPAIPETTNYVRKVRAIYPNRSATASTLMAAAMPEATAEEEGRRIYRVVDQRGMVHFSNIEPPN